MIRLNFHMVKPVAGLSIPMPILRLNFITKLIFIHPTIKTYDLTYDLF